MQIANRESFAVASTRRRLPYDSRVEYLQSSGTQYIDTGYTPTADTNVVISFSVTSAQATQGIFGQRTAALNNSLLLLQYKWNDTTEGWQLRWDRGTGSQNVLSPSAGLRYTGTSKGTQFTLNDTTVSVTSTNSGGYSLYLFAVNQRGSPILLAPSLRVYSFAIFSNGILVHDYVPVRKGDAGYLYDRITGQLLGNAGTGNFVLGADLPYDAEVEYLESTGTQYVDTGFVATSNSNVEVEFALASIKSGSIFGARRRLGVSTFGARIMPYQSVPRYRWDYGSTDVYLTSVDVTVGRHTLATSGNKITYDSSVSATVPSAFSPSGLNIVIFALNENGSINAYSNGLRVCRFSILDAGVLVRDFIPVRVGRVGYLYDVVTGQLCGNAADGGNGFPAACVGPDIN